MIEPKKFYDTLIANGTDFFAGVPDSLLKNFCAYVTDNADDSHHIIAANEGCAVGLASGYHFATGKTPLVYMQNSGLGNIVNPLLSLADSDVYSVPMILVVGWRGEPGVHDEPQHVKQGKVTCELLEAMQIPYAILTDDETKLDEQIKNCYSYMKEHSSPYAFVVRKNTFAEYKLQKNIPVVADMSREEAIDVCVKNLDNDTIFVSTTGMASRELFELREKLSGESEKSAAHKSDFLTVGSMGHASQIALSIAIQKPSRRVVCIDGDGAVIMHTGGMTTIGVKKPSNFIHIVMNNGAHDSVGGQPTVGLQIDLCGIAKSCGYENVVSVKNEKELATALVEAVKKNVLSFIEVKVKKGARKDLGRPTSTPQENKIVFMQFVQGQ